MALDLLLRQARPPQLHLSPIPHDLTAQTLRLGWIAQTVSAARTECAARRNAPALRHESRMSNQLKDMGFIGRPDGPLLEVACSTSPSTTMASRPDRYESGAAERSAAHPASYKGKRWASLSLSSVTAWPRRVSSRNWPSARSAATPLR